MKFYQYDGTRYVTAHQLEQGHQLSRKKCWQILFAARGSIRMTRVGNIPLYAWEDCLDLFAHLAPAPRR